MRIIRAERGTDEKIVDVNDIEIADLWHVGHNMCLKAGVRANILAVWHLAHDMKAALESISHGADLTAPIHTKRLTAPIVEPCEACQGAGWIVTFSTDKGNHIERCDACEKFSGDETAERAAIADSAQKLKKILDKMGMEK